MGFFSIFFFLAWVLVETFLYCLYRKKEARNERPSIELLVRAVQETPETCNLLLLLSNAAKKWKVSHFCQRYYTPQKQGLEIHELELT